LPFRSKAFLPALLGLLAWLLAACHTGPGQRPAGALPWAAYYSDKEPGAAFSRYKLVVFDWQYHPPLSARPRPTYLAYLSVGEVDAFRPHFEAVKRQGLLAGRNERWGSHFVDVRDPRWQARVLDELVPAILEQGFDGVLLDTLDSAIYLEEQAPETYKGMQSAACRLVLAVRERYPRLLIAVNRAYPLLPCMENHIDFLLAESLLGGYDFEQKTYRKVSRGESRSQLDTLLAARKRRPDLTVLTLDYWDPNDLAGIERLYRKQIANGFHPYVTTILLDTLGPFPANLSRNTAAFGR